MFAFTHLTNGILVKVYDCGADWQLIASDKRGVKVGEWWFSVWATDRSGSLKRAMERACERLGGTAGALLRTEQAAA